MYSFSSWQFIPLPVELVGVLLVNVLKFFFQVGRQVNGAVEVLPNQSVMLDILDKVVLSDVAHRQILYPVDRHYANILDGSEQVLE